MGNPLYNLLYKGLTMSRKHSLTAIIYDKKDRVLSIGQNSYTKTHIAGYVC